MSVFTPPEIWQYTLVVGLVLNIIKIQNNLQKCLSKARQSLALHFIQGRSNHSMPQGALGKTFRTNKLNFQANRKVLVGILSQLQ